MENSLFLCYLTAVRIFLNVHQVQPVEVKWTSKPWISGPVYETSTVNFTYRFSNLSMVKKIKFGTCLNDDHTVDKEIISVTQKKDGNITVRTQKTYEGRIRWVGDVSRKLAKFELSDIKISESESYGLEIEHGDGYRIRCTKINVKELPRLSILHNNVTCVKGKSANFIWNYTLAKGDTNALSLITFGIYKDGAFRIICIVQVENATMKRPNCSTGARKRNTSFDSEVKIPTSTVKFVLNQVDLDDEAEYSIRLGGPWQNILENKKRLIVTVPPKFAEVPQNTSVVEGRTLNLTCMADGKPRPLITWLKDGEKLKTNSTTYFTLQYIAREDAGQYQCVAQNDLRIVTSSKAIVDVLYVPSINTSSKMKTIEAPIGTEMWLNCPTTANPPATLQWFKNGIPKEKGTDKFHVFIDSFYNDANYTCVAKNSVGEDNVTFNFRKVGPPSSPKVDCERQDDSMNSRWLNFRWNSPKDDGGAPILWYNVKHRSFVSLSKRESQKWINTNISNKITWYRFNLTWQRSFEFTITAWNKYGESKLDLDNTCLITVGKDSTTEMPSQKVVAAAPEKNTNGIKSMQNTWLYVGVGVGAFAVAVICLSIYWYRKRRNSRIDTHHISFNALTMESNMLEGSSVNSHLLQGDPQFRTRKQSMVGSPRYQMDPEWSISREKISILKVIGNGAFGLVYKGRVRGVGPNTLGWNVVAIKSPYADASESEVRDLMKEFELMKTLKPHPHVIKLLGFGEDEGRPLVIIEYVPFGDLLGYLRKSRGEKDDYYSDPEIKPNSNLSSQQLLRFGWHVADGMAYLASEKILHRDLAARNVLVGEGMSCKVTDFGMAKDVSRDDIYIRSTEGRLPVKWTAIEALTGAGAYTTQSDVWSFGVVLYEICTIGAEPFPGVAAKEIPQHIEKGYRMKRPGHVDSELYDVMMSCWQKSPDDRPTFPELKETLMKLEEFQSRDYINLKECLYQNIDVRENGPGSPRRREKGGTLKRSVEGNPYHVEPGTHGHVTTV